MISTFTTNFSKIKNGHVRFMLKIGWFGINDPDKVQDLTIFNFFTPLPIHFQLNLNTNTERVNSLNISSFTHWADCKVYTDLAIEQAMMQAIKTMQGGLTHGSGMTELFSLPYSFINIIKPRKRIKVQKPNCLQLKEKLKHNVQSASYEFELQYHKFII